MRQRKVVPNVANHHDKQLPRDYINGELVRRPMTPTELARRADVDSDTVSDFLAGKRWPQPATRHAISVALGWTPESIDLLAAGHQPEPVVSGTVSGSGEDAGVLASLPPEALEGLDAAERAEVIAAAKLSALQTAREIRRRLDS